MAKPRKVTVSGIAEWAKVFPQNRDLEGWKGKYQQWNGCCTIDLILDDENIKYDQMSVVNLIMKFAPDWRRILNELQRNSFVGNISGLSNDNNGSDNFSKLLNFIKDKDFKNMRQWVSNNIDTDSSYIFRGIYDNMTDHIAPQGIPQVILILADYQYKNAFVADHELNVVACLTEIMANVEFK